MYNPNTGTFTTLDPFVGAPTNPLSYNKYLYTQGDPINGDDPSGLDDEAAMAVLTQAMGGPRPPVVAPSPFPNNKAGLVLRLQTYEKSLMAEWPQLFRTMGLEKFFEILIINVQVQVAGVTIDPTLKPGDAKYVPGTQVISVSSLGINGTVGPTLVHEAVHAMDHRNGWFLATNPFSANMHEAESLGYGIELVLEWYNKLVNLRAEERTANPKTFQLDWGTVWRDINSVGTAGVNYNTTMTVIYPFRGKQEEQLTATDMAMVLKKLGITVKQALITPLFEPLPK